MSNRKPKPEPVKPELPDDRPRPTDPETRRAMDFWCAECQRRDRHLVERLRDQLAADCQIIQDHIIALQEKAHQIEGMTFENNLLRQQVLRLEAQIDDLESDTPLTRSTDEITN